MKPDRVSVEDLFCPTPLRAVHIACSAVLEKLESLFKPECRLTLLMRTPDDPAAEIVFTKDDLEEVIKALQRFRVRDAIKASAAQCPGGAGCECCGSGCTCGCRDSCPNFVEMIERELE